MSFLDGVTQQLDSIKNQALDLFGLKKTVAGATLIDEAKGQGVATADTTDWTYTGQDWYKTYPYSFVVEKLFSGDPGDVPTQFTYTLPIPPSSIITKMITASQVTPTVGGVVEETSDNLFWVVQLRGTTGTAVTRGDKGRDEVAKKFRNKLETTGLLSGIAANLQSLANTVGGVADAITSGQVLGAVNNALLPPMPYSGSSVDGDSNGFTEIQELHKFLYVYSRLRAAFPNTYSLFYNDYKNGYRFRASVQDFTIDRSAANPNLYNYTIQLKCWAIQSVDSAGLTKEAFDRFGPDGDLQTVNTIGASQYFKLFKGLQANLSTAQGFGPGADNTAQQLLLKPG